MSGSLCGTWRWTGWPNASFQKYFDTARCILTLWCLVWLPLWGRSEWWTEIRNNGSDELTRVQNLIQWHQRYSANNLLCAGPSDMVPARSLWSLQFGLTKRVLHKMASPALFSQSRTLTPSMWCRPLSLLSCRAFNHEVQPGKGWLGAFWKLGTVLGIGDNTVSRTDHSLYSLGLALLRAINRCR